MPGISVLDPVVSALDKLQHNESVDAVAAPVRSAVSSLLAGRKDVADVLHGVWLSHPLHPMLVQVPIGAWTSAAILDFMPGGAKSADRLIGIGVLSAVPAAVTGLADWSDSEPEQMRVGLAHSAANVLALGCYLASLGYRRSGKRMRGKALAMMGLGLASAGGFIGGDLAYRHAMGANHVEEVRHTVPSGWHPLGELAALPDGQPVQREVGGHPVLVVRHGEQVDVLADRCSHLGAPLHEGKLATEAGERCIVCPWHGSTFRLRDGAVVHGPATAAEPVFLTRVVAGQVEASLTG